MNSQGSPDLFIRKGTLKFPRGTGDGWSLETPDLHLEPKTLYSLKGPNMSGKSTLLMILAGLWRSRESTSAVEFDILTDVFCGSKYDPVQALLMSTQDRLFPDLTILQNVMVMQGRSISNSRSSRENLRSKLKSFLDQHDIFANITNKNGDRTSGLVGELSTGARTYVHLARAYCHSPRYLLIDELTSNLDDKNAELFFETLKKDCIQQQNGGAVMIAHNDDHHQIFKDVAKAANFNYNELNIGLECNVLKLRVA